MRKATNMAGNNPAMSITTLSINGVNAPVNFDIVRWIKKQDPTKSCL